MLPDVHLVDLSISFVTIVDWSLCQPRASAQQSEGNDRRIVIVGEFLPAQAGHPDKYITVLIDGPEGVNTLVVLPRGNISGTDAGSGRQRWNR